MIFQLSALVSVWLSEAGLGKLLVGVIKKKSPSAALSNSSSFSCSAFEGRGEGRLLQVPSILLGQDVWTKKCDWCSISGRLCCQYCLWASPSSIHLPQCFSHLSNISIFRCFHILFLTFFLGSSHRLHHLVLQTLTLYKPMSTPAPGNSFNCEKKLCDATIPVCQSLPSLPPRISGT